ncbi:plasmid mobilization relaxosome protein MobC [Pseudoalteromonas sp. ASV78]|uniref:plasmid mobilization relaxosome protein MobC n=1 Tax=Pseudoalteromonas sp. ASV78 TaxID=3397851 RepID=UPI0039FD9233
MVSAKRKQYLDDYVDQRKRINISLSADEFTKVSYLADLNHTKPTSFIAQLVQHHLNKSPFISSQLQDEIKEMKYLLRNVANNINQIAHRSNTLKVMVDERDLLMELKKLEDGIATFITKEANK